MATETKAPSVATVTLNIDGQDVTVPKGTNVIEAARTVGVDIPYLCYHHQLTPFGGCRLCLVEIEKAPKLLAACNTTVADGMVVRTTGDRVQSQRAGSLEFILLNHPLDCPVCDKGGECELQDRTFEYSNAVSRMTEPKIHIEDYDLGPLIVRNQDRCIICKRCVKVMEEIVGDPVLEFGQRGVTTEVYTFEHSHFPAGFSGNTIRVCPVGALMSKPFRFKARPWELIKTPGLCTQCGVGCNVRQDVRENKLLRLVGLENKQVNDGWLCDRGQFGYDYINSEQRLTQPMIRSAAGRLEQASWDDAIGLIVSKLKEVKAVNPSAFGAIGSERASNEDNFVLQQFTRQVIGSANIDHRLGSTRRDYHAHRPKPGAILDLEKADIVLLIGTDLTAEAPVLDLVLKRSLLFGKSKLIIANPRHTDLNKSAAQWLQYTPGTEIALINALIQATLEAATAPVAGVDVVKQGIGSKSVAQLAELAGTNEAAIRSAAALFSGARLGSILYGRSAAESRDGAYFLAALHNLTLISGHAGKPGHVALEVVTEANTWGARDMGVLPDAGVWGEAVTNRGLGTGEMLQAAIDGKLQALYVMQSNPAVEFANQAKALQALKAVPFLVVQDMFLTETAQLAHVVLPSTSGAERNCTFTNIEGRVQRTVRAMSPRGGSLDDWQSLANIAEDLGSPLGYETVDSVVKVLREALNGRSTSSAPKLQRVETPPTASSDPNHPMRLFTGRVMFDHSTIQGQSSVLPGLAPALAAEVNPADAARLGITDGETVGVVTAIGSLSLPVRVTEDVPAGSVFVPSGFNEAPVTALLGEGLTTTGCRLVRASE